MTLSLLADNPSRTSFLLKFALFLTIYRSLLTGLFNVVQEASVGELSKYVLINIFPLSFPHLSLNAKPFHLCPPTPKHGLINIHLGSNMSDDVVTLKAEPDWTGARMKGSRVRLVRYI